MAQPSAFIRKIQAEKEAAIKYHRRFTMQWCADAAILAANEVFKRKGDIIVEFFNKYREYANEIANMTIEDAKGDKTLEYTKTRLDGRLKEILGDAFQDWDERYGDI